MDKIMKELRSDFIDSLVYFTRERIGHLLQTDDVSELIICGQIKINDYLPDLQSQHC